MPEPNATPDPPRRPKPSRLFTIARLLLGTMLWGGAAASLAVGHSWYLAGALVVLALVVAYWMGNELTGKQLWSFSRHLVGPLYLWELIRLARRGRSTLLRTTYALFLTAGLCILYAQHFTGGDVLALLDDSGQRISLQHLADYSRSFVMTTLVLQGVAVMILTPPYIASAVTEEKERGTLPLLFTTHLHDHEIVFGKLLARVTHLAGILLAGLPILGLAQLWGGVDFLMLAAMTVVTLVSLLSYGSICILVSVQYRHSWAAILTSYMILAGVATCCGCVPLIHLASPFGLLVELHQQLAGNPRIGLGLLSGSLPTNPLGIALSLVGQYVVVHGIITLVCVTWASRGLRSTARSAPPMPLPRVERIGGWDPADAPVIVIKPTPKPSFWRFDTSRPLGDHALLWKEASQGAVGSTAAFFIDMATLLFVVFLIIEGILLGTIGSGPGRQGLENYLAAVRQFVNPSVRVVTIVLGLVLSLGIAFRAAGSLSRERDQKTLDSLLMLPVQRREILFAKWLGSILRMRRLIVLLLVLWAFGIVTTALHPLAALALAVAMAIHMGLLAAIGVWLSLACRNTVSAYFAMALMLLLLFLGSWMVLLNTTIGATTWSPFWQWFERFLEIGLNPLSAWWILSESFVAAQDNLASLSERFQQIATALAAGLAVFALLGLLVWFAAEQRLGGEPRRRRARLEC